MKATLTIDAIAVASVVFPDEWNIPRTDIRLEPNADALRAGLFNRHTVVTVIFEPERT